MNEEIKRKIAEVSIVILIALIALVMCVGITVVLNWTDRITNNCQSK